MDPVVRRVGQEAAGPVTGDDVRLESGGPEVPGGLGRELIVDLDGGDVVIAEAAGEQAGRPSGSGADFQDRIAVIHIQQLQEPCDDVGRRHGAGRNSVTVVGDDVAVIALDDDGRVSGVDLPQPPGPVGGSVDRMPRTAAAQRPCPVGGEQMPGNLGERLAPALVNRQGAGQRRCPAVQGCPLCSSAATRPAVGSPLSASVSTFTCWPLPRSSVAGCPQPYPDPGHHEGRRTGTRPASESAHGLGAVDRLADDVGVAGVLRSLGDDVQ